VSAGGRETVLSSILGCYIVKKKKENTLKIISVDVLAAPEAGRADGAAFADEPAQ